jgi:predicted N-acetyltransferase YhbS
LKSAVIREATAADDAAIGELLVRAFEEKYARKMPEVVITDERRATLRDVAAKRTIARVWVAEEGGRVVGTVALWPPGMPGWEGWVKGAFDLRHLAVDASHRGRGISSQLCEAAEAYARAQKAPGVCLHVRRGAHGVAGVYTARGYLRMPEGDLDKSPEVFLEAFFLAL